MPDRDVVLRMPGQRLDVIERHTGSTEVLNEGSPEAVEVGFGFVESYGSAVAMKPFTQAVAQGPIDLRTPQFWEEPARVTMGDEMAQPDPDQFLVARNIALGRRRFQASAVGRMDTYKQIGREPRRESGWPYVYISMCPVSYKKQKT